MTDILHIKASPRGSRSHSTALAREFLRQVKDVNPKVEVSELELWTLELPEFDETCMDAKFKIAGGEALTPEEAAAWAKLKSRFEVFASARKYVFSVPMWNFGIPYKLKHFIDVVAQPGLAFKYADGACEGLLKDRKALLVAVRGGVFGGLESPYDFQIKYIKAFLGFVGISDVEVVLAEGLNGPGRAAALDDAKTKLGEIAKGF